jgi:hypothetical protein
MAKPLSREELTRLDVELSEEEDPFVLHGAITKLVKSHRSLWAATDALTNHIQRERESQETRRKART